MAGASEAMKFSFLPRPMIKGEPTRAAISVSGWSTEMIPKAKAPRNLLIVLRTAESRSP